MNKLLTFLMLGILLLSGVSSLSLGDFDSGENVTIVWTCADCSYVNFSVMNADQVLIIDNVQGSQQGSLYSYVVEGYLNNIYGDYLVSGSGDVSDVETSFSYDYTIHRGDLLGFDFTSTFGILILLLFVALLIFLYSVKAFLLSGAILVLLSLVLIFNGYLNIFTIIPFVLGVMLIVGN